MLSHLWRQRRVIALADHPSDVLVGIDDVLNRSQILFPFWNAANDRSGTPNFQRMDNPLYLRVFCVLLTEGVDQRAKSSNGFGELLETDLWAIED